jgi:hypothetical protein
LRNLATRLAGSASCWESSRIGDGEGAGKCGLGVVFMKTMLVVIGTASDFLRQDRLQKTYTATIAIASTKLRIRSFTLVLLVRFEF